MSAFVLGSTGLVGKLILAECSTSPQFTSVTTVSRRQPEETSTKLKAIVETDTKKWPEIIANASSSVFFSAFGTTRKAAGSADKFVEIDYGINYEAAKAAKEAGVDTFVLISSAGANASSFLLYPRTKGELERDVIALKFKRTLIFRPGMLLGERGEGRGGMEQIASGLISKVVGTPLAFLGFPVYGDKLAKLAVKLSGEGWKDGDEPEVRIIGCNEIMKTANEL